MSLLGEDKNQKGSIDRNRANLLKNLEQPTLLFLCRVMPKFLTPDILTAIGMLGTLLIFFAFYYAHVAANKIYLLLAIVGFAINWFGDSLDGRIAYYRNIPRKWYGFALDCIMDWLSLVFMSLGFYLYIDDAYKIYVFLFACNYGWIVLVAQLKYKITDKYSIDPGPIGPTEVRILLCLVILAEWYFGNVLIYFSLYSNILFLIINLVDTYKLLQSGNARDAEEKRLKAEAAKQNA
ncbi:MAG: CDP-alcohol phosphatidyltransferase family protein [Bacteroidetes bacterium]|nr:CDP-alcohol phosphatidyltransferase family protein [Bacteroidota bacterium]